jgi:hypothetical protein
MAATAALTGFGSGAFAQQGAADKIRAKLDAAAQKIQAACADDVAKFCSNVTKGNGRVIHCMLAYEDQISTKCDYAVFEAQRNLQRALDRTAEVADACWSEIQKYCGNAPEGGGGVAQCLVKNKAAIKKGCRAAVNKLSAK